MTRTNLTIIASLFAAAACRPTTPAPAPRPQRPAPQLMQPISSLSAHRLVPEPVSVTAGSGAPFTLTAATTVTVPANDTTAGRIGEMFAAILRPSTGFRFPVSPSDGAAPNGTIAFALGGPS